MDRFRTPLLAALIGTAVLLSSCAGPTGLNALKRDATPADKLPPGVTLYGGVTRDSARLLATWHGNKYFAAQSDDVTRACVAVVPSDSPPQSVVGCGSQNQGGKIVVSSSSGWAGSVALVDDGYDTRTLEADGWTKIQDNILVRMP